MDNQNIMTKTFTYSLSKGTVKNQVESFSRFRGFVIIKEVEVNAFQTVVIFTYDDSKDSDAIYSDSTGWDAFKKASNARM